jgi:3-methyl-2-oxobutanoate hydroxymethyltransferase
MRLFEVGACGVKLKGGVSRCREIAAIVGAGIPVMGHIGMLPQQVLVEGGYKIKGKTSTEAEQLCADAVAVEKAGAFAMVMEWVRHEVASKITATMAIPPIGIDSGSDCDSQVLVIHDLIGLFPWFRLVHRRGGCGQRGDAEIQGRGSFSVSSSLIPSRLG